MKSSKGYVDNSLVFERPKILLIAPPHINIAEPFRTALEKNGFVVTMADSSPSPSRSPHTEQFALVVDLRQNGRHETGDGAIGSHLIDATFLSPNQTFPGTIQLFRNGVYQLGADEADVDKFVDTVRELCGEQTASCHSDQRQASSDQQPATSDQQPDLIGQSPQIKEVRQLIKCFSQFPGMPVLITGETGTGKEVVANLLHYFSPRAGKPLIKINCSAIPEALFESQLFGHRKGAFTGATSTQKGLVEEAMDSTLFLDELSTLTLAQQVKLLRFLQDGSYIPVGGTVEHRSNAWIIAATNQDLAEQVKKGEFREDLYHRLKALQIHLPTLRERPEDILLLAHKFLEKAALKYQMSVKLLAEETKAVLLGFNWPGNVRELEQLMEVLMIKVDDDTILPEHLPAEFGKMKSATKSGYENITALEDLEKAHIVNMLQKTGGNLSESARLLGIDRHTLARRIKKHHIKIGAFRTK